MEKTWFVSLFGCIGLIALLRANQAKILKTAQGSSTPKIKLSDELLEGDVFEIFVSPADRFKFNAAHFIAYKGFRECLHGHNYSVSVKLIGRRLGHDGYLLDFGDVKTVVTKLCKELNEKFILPVYSDALEITYDGKQVNLVCEDRSQFSFPRTDVAELPIFHSSAEEISRYLWKRIISEFTPETLLSRGIHTLQICVAEMPNQQACFRRAVSHEHVIDDTLSNEIRGCL